MKTPLMLDVPATPSKRVLRRQEMEELKRQFGIQTHGFKHGTKSSIDWMALSMPMAARLLNGHQLTKEQQTDLSSLMAGYCRLLDDGNLIADGYPTEYAAVRAAVDIAIAHGEKPLP